MNIFTESKSALAKKLLAQKGWTRRDLALQTGIPVAVISNVLCGNNRSKKARAAIEGALGTTFWEGEGERAGVSGEERTAR